MSSVTPDTSPNALPKRARNAAASFLAGLRLGRQRVDALPEALEPADLSAAYAEQNVLVEQLVTAWGGPRAGYKVALTNKAAQAMLGVFHPVYGQLVGGRVHADGACLVADDYVVRLLEAEFAFRLASDVPAQAAPYTASSIAAHVASVLPAIELVEFHFAAINKVTPTSMVADNAIHGAWIHGAECTAWRELDLAQIATRLTVNGEVALRGTGANVMQGPLSALAWLANTLPAHGHALKAGDYVTTGVTTDEIYPASAGDEVVASFGAVGEVTVSFR